MDPSVQRKDIAIDITSQTNAKSATASPLFAGSQQPQIDTRNHIDGLGTDENNNEPSWSDRINTDLSAVADEFKRIALDLPSRAQTPEDRESLQADEQLIKTIDTLRTEPGQHKLFVDFLSALVILASIQLAMRKLGQEQRELSSQQAFQALKTAAERLRSGAILQIVATALTGAVQVGMGGIVLFRAFNMAKGIEPAMQAAQTEAKVSKSLSASYNKATDSVTLNGLAGDSAENIAASTSAKASRAANLTKNAADDVSAQQANKNVVSDIANKTAKDTATEASKKRDAEWLDITARSLMTMSTEIGRNIESISGFFSADAKESEANAQRLLQTQEQNRQIADYSKDYLSGILSAMHEIQQSLSSSNQAVIRNII